MTRDDIIRMVRDNGLRMSVQGSYFFIGFDDLGKLLDVRAASEREACAKLCETADRYRGEHFAAKIRERGAQ